MADKFYGGPDDVDAIMQRIKLAEFFDNHFHHFVAFAVLAYYYFIGDSWQHKHPYRAKIVGTMLSERFEYWRIQCRAVGITTGERENISRAIANLLVGHEPSIVEKIEQNYGSNLSMDEVRSAVEESIINDNCPKVENLKRKLYRHYGLNI